MPILALVAWTAQISSWATDPWCGRLSIMASGLQDTYLAQISETGSGPRPTEMHPTYTLRKLSKG